MKTNIRLLVAIAAMLAAPALNAQSRSGHNPGGSTRPGHHTTFSGSSHSSSSSHNPGRPAHRPNPAYRPAHRPTPPPAYRPAHRPSVGYVFRPLAGVTYTLCRFAETIATISACNAIARAANTNYYYNDGCFYKKRYDGRYEVVVPSAGAIVYSLPDYYETLTLNGVLYYKVYDTLYSLIVDASGTPAFMVVGQMNG